MNVENFVIPQAGDSFEEGAVKFGGRLRLNETQVAWTMAQLNKVKQGVMHLEVFKDRLARRDFGGAVPFARETMTTSDFPLMLLANIADRALLAGYNEAPPTWMQYARQKTNSDLKPAYLFAVDGGEGPLDLVNELAPYPEGHLDESQFTVKVRKYGRIFRFSLESFLSDGLNAFNSTPARMGRAARRTEDKLATSLYATDAAKAAMFTTNNKNKVVTANGAATNNPVFGVAGLKGALAVMAKQLDADGQPIDLTAAVVVVPAALQGAINEVQHLMQINSKNGIGDSNNEVWMSNPYANLTYLVNPRLDIDSETNGTTGWYVFQNPNIGRPALVMASLMGHESPEMFVKSPNAIAIGGGSADALGGDFDTDSIAYKVRMWKGGTRVDPKSVVYSNGTAS